MGLRTRNFSVRCAVLAFAAPLVLSPLAARASDADIVLPDLGTQTYAGMNGHTLLSLGLIIAALGILFGLVTYKQLKNLAVHKSMGDVSDLIYETCKTYLLNQGKFILMLWVCIAAVMVAYFGFLRGESDATLARTLREQGLTEYGRAAQVGIILLFSLVGIAGSYAVAWFGMRVNTFANSRTAMASLGGKARPVYAIPLKAGMSIGMVLISIELFIMLFILLFVPRI